MVVQHNMQAINANRMLNVTSGAQAKSTEKLSSGYRINRAADDAAGLSISEKMRKQIKGLSQASKNAQDGVSCVQTAEGALNEIHSMLQRMNELAVQSSNETNSESDRKAIQDEINQLTTEIDRVSETTKFNETYLLKGSGDKSAKVKAEAMIGTTTQKATTDDANTFASIKHLQELLGDDYEVSLTYEQTWKKNNSPDVFESGKVKSGADGKDKVITSLSAGDFTGVSDTKAGYTASDIQMSLTIARKANVDITDALKLDLQVGADGTDENKISVEIDAMSARGLGIDGLKVDGSDSKNADAAIETIANAIQKVSDQRSALGAVQNRLEHTISNLDNVVENTTSAESRIRDTDMAEEMVNYSKNNILAQAGQSMLAQANQSTQGVLSLLG